MFKSFFSEQLSQYYSLRSAVLSDSALKHELCYLRRFDGYLSERGISSGQISEALMCDWVGSLIGKSSSIENEVIVIRRFLNYLKLSGECVSVPVIPKVRDDYVPYIFSDEELAGIFTSADNIITMDKRSDAYLSVEFPVILRLLYSCGLRIGETVRINTSDIDLENGILRLVNTKGNKHRLVPMSLGMTVILERYCMAMGMNPKGGGWLFPSSKSDSHISDRAIKRRFEKILKDNGIRLANRKKHERGPCLHCMRHVFAFKSFAQAERAGRHVDDAVPYLSIYLGHDSLDETSKYLKFSSEMFPDAVDAFGNFMEELMPEVDYET